MNYEDFLKSKTRTAPESGFQVDRETMNPRMFEWQNDIVIWGWR